MLNLGHLPLAATFLTLDAKVGTKAEPFLRKRSRGRLPAEGRRQTEQRCRLIRPGIKRVGGQAEGGEEKGGEALGLQRQRTTPCCYRVTKW